MHYDVIVIGAGNGGLSTATKLDLEKRKYYYLKNITFLEDVELHLEEGDLNLR